MSCVPAPNLRLICGFTKQRDIPSESTFSRAFADFASCELGAVVHDTLVQDYLQGELIGHVSRDSTAIIGREKAARKEKMVKVPRKRGRRPKESNVHRQKRNGWTARYGRSRP